MDKQVSVEEVVTSLSYQMEALIQILEEKGLLTRVELIEKVRKLLEEKQRPT